MKPISRPTLHAGLWHLFILTLLLSLTSHAEYCEIRSSKVLFSKISKNHPDVNTVDQFKAISIAEIKRARQRPNPLLKLGANQGDSSGLQNSESEFELQYVFEMGDKRDSRIEAAMNRQRLSDLRLDNKVENLLIDAANQIQRLAQIQSLLNIYQESIEVFKKTRNSLKENKSLSPEQMVQADILDIEVGKHRLKISELKSELKEVINLLQYSIGEPCSFQIEELKLEPEPLEEIAKNDLQLPRNKELEMDVKLSKSLLNLEDSLAYPDLMFGPNIQWVEMQGQKFERFGLSLTMELPILNRNKGGRAAAQSTLNANETLLKIFQSKNQALIDAKLNAYREVTNALKEIPPRAELVKKHHRIESFFVRGLISVSTMLEGHDQLLSLIDEIDRNEILATRYLLELKQAEGSLRDYLKKWSMK